MAFDPSLRGFAYATCQLNWNGDWREVKTSCFDGGAIKRGAPERLHHARLDRILDWIELKIEHYAPEVFAVESYGWASKPDTDVVELVGCLKRMCRATGATIDTLNQSGARTFLLAPEKVPRKGADAKKACRDRLATINPALGDLTLDETDALVILNDLLYRQGGRTFV